MKLQAISVRARVYMQELYFLAESCKKRGVRSATQQNRKVPMAHIPAIGFSMDRNKPGYPAIAQLSYSRLDDCHFYVFQSVR